MAHDVLTLKSAYRDTWYSFFLNRLLTPDDRLNMLEVMAELENDIVDSMDDTEFFLFLDSLPCHNEYWMNVPDIFDVGEGFDNGKQ